MTWSESTAHQSKAQRSAAHHSEAEQSAAAVCPIKLTSHPLKELKEAWRAQDTPGCMHASCRDFTTSPAVFDLAQQAI
ncbi:unnamed protein product [Fusarium graminearum]|uniref:Chromosome 4, complete genome n=2 Tax=Gibberella zeae TaxID=5518 RepID=A0A098DWC9_GIBZE|nr:unnamed protein product [Fusarium graminearum]CAF3642248.1 unnamed protein product [Fusarium graminearum]CAF3643792.1 unnamed protein product [Fusarium graminearum]CAG1972164.1 unnamed protein product [Fusarium graminearum]CAG1995435.1 unnamed protein product [Fusarium graminearum]